MNQVTSDWNAINGEGQFSCLNYDYDYIFEFQLGEDNYRIEFDSAPDCCENFGCHLIIQNETKEEENNIDFNKLNYSEIKSFHLKYNNEENSFIVVFDLINDSTYKIVCYNDNGYYPHSFDIYKNGQQIFHSVL